MPESYTKLFNSIITSTIWTEDDQTRIVWITLLAIADKNGEVQASIPGLAKVAGVSVTATEIAIRKFLSPDTYSRTKDEEGRRVEEIPGGWALINHAKYRDMASREDAARRNAERQARFRARKRAVTREVTGSNAPVTECNAETARSNAPVTHDLHIAEADAEALGEVSPKPSLAAGAAAGGGDVNKPSTTVNKRFVPPTLGEWIEYAGSLKPTFPAGPAEQAWDHYVSNGWKVGKNPMKDWKGACRTCRGRWLDQGSQLNLQQPTQRPSANPFMP